MLVSDEEEKYSESLGFTDIEVLEENMDDNEPILFLETQKGRTILHYDGHQYRRTNRSSSGTRWQCAASKQCGAHLCLNESNDIIIANPYHDHDDDDDDDDEQIMEAIDPDESGELC